MRRLTTETVKSTALSLESIDDVQGGDSLALSVLSVGDGVTDNTLEEGLEDTSGFFVDHWKEDALTNKSFDDEESRREKGEHILAEIRLTPPRRARRRIAGLVIPWMLSRRIFR